MTDGYLLGAEAIREIKRELAETRLELSNLRRNFAHVSVRRHQTMYMPGKGQHLALFTDHVSPTSPTVTYPVVTGRCRKFPAYLVPSYTFDDATSGGSYSCSGSGTGASSSDYGEAIVVYNLTPFHVPKNTIAPVFKVNNKWFIDYRKHYGPWYGNATAPILSSSSDSDITSLVELNELSASTRYWGFTVDLATGVFTAQLSGDWLVTLTVLAYPVGTVGTTPLVARYKALAVSGGPFINMADTFLQWSNGATGNSFATASSCGIIRAGQGETWKFVGARTSGSVNVEVADVRITMERMYML